MRHALFGTALLALTASSISFAQAPAGEPEFTPERFRSHVAFLGDDRLEGRDAGTRGYDLGALYVATQFEGLGLKPANGDSWYQQVPFVKFAIDPSRSAVTVGGRRFAHGAEVTVSPSAEQGPRTFEAPVVFVGYGIDAPEIGIDDYKGLDVRGKIVAMLGGTPKGLPSDIAAHLNSEKRRMAEKNGAAGIISLRTTREAAMRPWARAVARAGEPAMSWVGKDGKAFSPAPAIGFRATFDTPAAEALFAGAPRTLAQVLADAEREGSKPKGFALKPRVRFDQASTVERTTSPNVLAVLPGSDPTLAAEHVLLMAHLDGLGVHDREGDDDIHNGAMDNATGVATLIEVARAMTSGGQRPKRSILLAAVTAEEDGLLGAQYLANNPAVEKLVGVVNLDMPVLLYDFKDVIAFGAEHSTMGPIVARAGARMGVKLSPDPLPQEGLFTRSDHYRFVQQGIPSVFLMTGFENGGQEKFTGFLSGAYHSPKDDLNLPFDWQAGAKFAKLNYLIAREIADAPEAPRWYSDSFFGKTLAPNAPKAKR
ncbi:M20/M25/M40 family metallo-hydrolase [Sphingomonas parva]|uniref:M20/M25/M40 family metallo-hydrolase n=1 Tax=Sphingomonas parva TaxID=2555898 RepID=A0A4Y8ZVA1_9SPHN|nr:M28 family metallopeptidase [Sphingomonas parva]TFI59958.1 M20/M25/M40 family metallo-hydrolase [Sphingomonas parva]